ncbi:MAG: efflux RND transporter permease subunit [Kiritimatiellae bacterium]|nr:efflux RND transporter permease subunit [Kiritimatiellia bacterium]
MFSQFFINRPRFAFVLAIALSLCGAIALFQLPVEEYPEIAPVTIRVSANYPGASAQVVADTIALPVEDQINGVENVLYYSSTCNNSGSYSCSVTFASGADSDMSLVNLQNAVKRAEAKLPAVVKQQGISVQKRNSDMLAMYAFTTDGRKYSLQQLGDFVEQNVKEAVMRLEGVSVAEVVASQAYAMRVWLNPVRMSGLGISISDVSRAIEAQNVQAAAGTVGSEYANRYLSYKLNVDGRLKTAEEFAAIVVRNDPESGGQVLLGDVARVEIGSRSYAGRSAFNGRESIGLTVYKTPEANALEVVDRVKATLDDWMKRLPEGVTCDIANDATSFTRVFMHEIETTLFLALALVVLITWVFLQDLRATLVPAVAIPISLLAAFVFIWAFGFTINILTMFGLILVIGSLVDDAIVVVENTQTLMAREGLSAKEAASKSMRQITGAVIATTLVTVACYIPLAFYGGMVGKMYIQFAFTMCVALSLSTLVALTLSPVLCSLILRAPGKPSRLFAPVNFAIDGARRGYLAVVRLLVRRAVVTAILFAAAAGGCWLLKDQVKETLLPDEDKGMVMMDVELPQGATLERTNRVLDDIQKRIQGVPGVKGVMLVSGSGSMSGSGEHCGMGVLLLDHWDNRKTPETQVGAIIGEIRRRTADVYAAKVTCFTTPAISGLGRLGGVGFNLCSDAGADATALAAAAQAFARRIQELPEAGRVTCGFRADTPQLRLTLDRQKAKALGVDPSTVFSTLQNKLASVYVNDFNKDGRAYEVLVQSQADFRATPEDVADLHVPGANGTMVPLAAIATVAYEIGSREVTRFNKMPSASINAQAAPGVAPLELISAIERAGAPEGYHVEWSEMSLQEKENQGRLGLLMGLAALFAYLFLVAQYESWTIPLPVMCSVVFALAGAYAGLWITGTPMSIYAQLGLVMLIGLSAKNAILMVEFSKQQREEAGLPVADAALKGADLRFRAVQMTAWSFLCGVLPLVFATGAGAGSQKAIGISTFSGMLASTFVGIFFTPALYAIFQRLREFVKGFLRTTPKQ